jgi:hypothetical protein
MEAMRAPTTPAQISDPNNVSELVVNGPVNVMRTGDVVTFTFTVVRPDTTAVFAGEKNPTYKGVVAARIVMPTQMAQELARLLEQKLAAAGPTTGQA